MDLSDYIVCRMQNFNVKLNPIQEERFKELMKEQFAKSQTKIEKAFCLSLLSEVHDLRQVEKVLVHYNNSKRKAL
ncbi:MAG: hypothetical protein DRQ89_12575 [Epsilonproteobacteria bacterium]|nr:MAG: hypothetical protein DRQ89_12575 [Campylobacterota bacterium]